MIKKIYPAFSPALFLGLMLQPLPLRGFFKVVINRGLHNIQKKHPEISERLTEFYGQSVLIEVRDLFLYVILKIEEKLSADVVAHSFSTTTKAAIHGDLHSLLKLIQGESDGDALFFSRELSFEGDTEIVVAIRNAFDGTSIALAQEAFFIPKILQQGITKMTHDCETLRQSLLAPANKKMDQVNATVEQLQKKVTQLEKENKRLEARVKKQHTSSGDRESAND